MKKVEIDRLVALLIDIVLISMLSGFVGRIKLFDFSWFGFEFLSYLNTSFIVMLFYFLVVAIGNNGISFGKLIMKIKVVNRDSNEELTLRNRIYQGVFKSFAISFFLLTIIDYLIFNNVIFYDRILKLKTIRKEYI